MSYNWGPHYIVPTEALPTYSGSVLLREDFDEELLERELAELNLAGSISRMVNPWYYRRKGTTTWIKIGESASRRDNFPVHWDTTLLEDGQYEVLGLMHAFVKQGNTERAIARQNVVEVTIKN